MNSRYIHIWDREFPFWNKEITPNLTSRIANRTSCISPTGERLTARLHRQHFASRTIHSQGKQKQHDHSKKHFFALSKAFFMEIP